jgi:hypothetical protein
MKIAIKKTQAISLRLGAEVDKACALWYGTIDAIAVAIQIPRTSE